VLYTGGPRPYGYEGLGEVFVFTFFGIVAVTGSYYVHAERCRARRSCSPCRSGLLASAILVVNNVRDLETDRGRASGRSRCGWAVSARGAVRRDARGRPSCA
jgi:1,4-dihydroxy-2-naphthoate octaprenyltransferase